MIAGVPYVVKASQLFHDPRLRLRDNRRIQRQHQGGENQQKQDHQNRRRTQQKQQRGAEQKKNDQQRDMHKILGNLIDNFNQPIHIRLCPPDAVPQSA